MNAILKECISGVVALVFLGLQCLIIGIVNKQKKYAAFNEIFALLPVFINSAENYGFSDGTAKKRYVMDLAISALSTKLKMTADDVAKKYGDLISVKIEEILSTPHKKEVSTNA